ncbi:dimethyl sulfoxide reductase anchor subunit, partial [Salmonella enterica subsp. enterica serovar Anatum]|nr:dimethyl sulfoxide reductase anchor subunit [Salmonella enterica subsp. enterica serovar Anatum]
MNMLLRVGHSPMSNEIVLSAAFAALGGLGALGLLLNRATPLIKTLTNGCICCTRSNELEDALLDLLDSRDRGDIAFDRLVIEC